MSDLARKLEVSDRHLRRTFRRELGATPRAIAQTRRIHLAKQLIQETQLSMLEVALASGFGSLRRFNAVFQQLYGRPPSALRHRRTPDPDATITIQLAHTRPYDWPGVRDHFEARAIPGIELVVGDEYSRTIAIGDVHGSLTIGPGTPRDHLAATIRFPASRHLPMIVDRLRRMLDLDANGGLIARHLGQDPWLEPLVDARPGLRVPGAWDAFEVAALAILNQQVSLEHGRMLVSRLAESAGASYAGPAAPAELTLVFPTAARVLASRTVLDGLPAGRRGALIALSQQLDAHPTQLGAWRDPRLVEEELGRVPGIGPWTVAYIRLRALRDPDAFPVTDAGLLRALANQARRPVSAGEARTRSEAWRPWRAYAAQHLWTAAGSTHRNARAPGRREAVA